MREETTADRVAPDAGRVPAGMRRIATRRSLFASRGSRRLCWLRSLRRGRAFGLICGALILQLRPDATPRGCP
jgi:hypothetical protein